MNENNNLGVHQFFSTALNVRLSVTWKAHIIFGGTSPVLPAVTDLPWSIQAYPAMQSGLIWFWYGAAFRHFYPTHSPPIISSFKKHFWKEGGKTVEQRQSKSIVLDCFFDNFPVILLQQGVKPLSWKGWLSGIHYCNLSWANLNMCSVVNTKWNSGDKTEFQFDTDIPLSQTAWKKRFSIMQCCLQDISVFMFDSS